MCIIALLSAFFDSEGEGPAPHQILNPAYQELGEYQGQQDLRCVYRFDKSSSWILSQIKKQTLSITESWYSMVLLAINEERWIIRYKVAKWPRSVSFKNDTPLGPHSVVVWTRPWMEEGFGSLKSVRRKLLLSQNIQQKDATKNIFYLAYV